MRKATASEWSSSEGRQDGQQLNGWIMEDDKDLSVTAKSDIPIGHQVALKDYRSGRYVYQLRVDIGKSGAADREGEHLHVHNVKTKRW